MEMLSGTQTFGKPGAPQVNVDQRPREFRAYRWIPPEEFDLDWLPEFKRVYDVLVGIGSYSLNLDAIRELQSPDPADLLRRDGGNLASVVRRINEEAPTQAASRL